MPEHYKKINVVCLLSSPFPSQSQKSKLSLKLLKGYFKRWYKCASCLKKKKKHMSKTGKMFCCCSATQLCSILCDHVDTARQAPLSFAISHSLLRFTSIELVILSNHLILCHHLLPSPSIFPIISVFSLVETKSPSVCVLFDFFHQDFTEL